MADIAKCGGVGCAVKDNCRRYTIKASPYQSWAGFDTEHRHNIHLRKTQPDKPCGAFIKANEKLFTVAQTSKKG